MLHAYGTTGIRWVLAATALLLESCTQLPSGPAAEGLYPVRGVTLVTWTRDGYSSAEADDALARILSTGANRVAILITYYQDHPTSSSVYEDSQRTPSLASLRHIILRARQRGFSTALKPHVDVTDGSWRGTIFPDDPARWFSSYSALLLPLASLADSLGAACFIIGTELGQTIKQTDRWRELILRTRERFSGSLTYAASWDEAQRIPFWRELDVVGIDFYAPLVIRSHPSRPEILAGWQLWLDRLSHLHRQTGRPLLFTEIGYRSIDGAGMEPYAHKTQGAPDPLEQADLYWGALEATSSAAWLEGLMWWNCRLDTVTNPGDTDYTPFGKPAESELHAAWGRGEFE